MIGHLDAGQSLKDLTGSRKGDFGEEFRRRAL
jgi:hypothetical protein